MCQIIFLVAVDKNGVMGCDGEIPWHYPEDVQRFKRITMGYPVIMGRKTWESLPVKPLPGRENIVLTKNNRYADHRCHVYDSFKTAIYDYRTLKVFVIGGAQIFKEYMDFADQIDITYINKEYKGNVYWPGIDLSQWEVISERISGDLCFRKYEKLNNHQAGV